MSTSIKVCSNLTSAVVRAFTPSEVNCDSLSRRGIGVFIAICAIQTNIFPNLKDGKLEQL
eukprot:5560652-Amphidinium_carterae.1